MLRAFGALPGESALSPMLPSWYLSLDPWHRTVFWVNCVVMPIAWVALTIAEWLLGH